jgi:hypothetical protein
LEITPNVRFVKKGQKKEEPVENEVTIADETNDEPSATADDNDEDDDWFKVKSKSDVSESVNIDLPVVPDKTKKLSKTKLAKKLRKKNLLINQRIEYDDDGNVMQTNVFN